MPSLTLAFADFTAEPVCLVTMVTLLAAVVGCALVAATLGAALLALSVTIGAVLTAGVKFGAGGGRGLTLTRLLTQLIVHVTIATVQETQPCNKPKYGVYKCFLSIFICLMILRHFQHWLDFITEVSPYNHFSLASTSLYFANTVSFLTWVSQLMGTNVPDLVLFLATIIIYYHGESLPLLVGLKPWPSAYEPAPLTLSNIHEEKALLLWKAYRISGEYFYLLESVKKIHLRYILTSVQQI